LTVKQLEDLISLYLNNYKTKELAALFNIEQGSVRQILTRYEIPKRPNNEEYRKYLINENYFNEIDTKEKAYFLGLLYADGCNNRKGFQITLCKGDKNVLLSLARALYKGTKHPFYEQLKKYTNLTCINKQVSIDLSKHGCVPNKTFRLKFPTFLSSDLLWSFIRGYFDGDGCAYLRNKTKLTISLVGYKSFLLQFQKFLKENGIASYLYKTSAKNQLVRSLVICDLMSATKFYFYAYAEATTLFLHRKRRKFYEFFKAHSS